MKKLLALFLLISTLLFGQEIGGYLFLDGQTAYCKIEDSQELRLSQSYTIELLVKLDTYNHWYNSSLVSKRDLNSSTGYIATITGHAHYTKYHAYIQTGEGMAPYIAGDKIINLDEWHHIAYVYNSETKVIKIFVDGQFDKELSNYPTYSNECLSDLIIGKDQLDNYFVDGNLDELRIWSYPRTQEQINEYKNQEIDHTNPAITEGLIAYYKFNELENLGAGNDGYADDVRDYGPYGFHADLEGEADIIFDPNSADWECELIISDASGNLPQNNLKFGQHHEATDGLDSFLGETPLPPIPPQNAFDIRWILPDEEASIIDKRNVALEEPQWLFRVQPGVNGVPIEVNWNPDEFPEGNFILTSFDENNEIQINMKQVSSVQLTDPVFNELVIKKTDSVSETIAVNDGWNIVSTPLSLPDMNSSSVFGEAVSETYGYNIGYFTEDLLEGGKSYLVKYDEPKLLEVTGTPFYGDRELIKGWNLIAPFDYEVHNYQFETIPAGIAQNHFFAYENGYVITEVMTPGNGYWLYAESDGLFTFNPAAQKSDNSSIVSDEEYINIVQNDGKSVKLYLSHDQLKINNYILPPKISNESFDARFEGDKLFANPENITKLNITADIFPLTITPSGNINLTINGKSVYADSDNPVTVSDKEQLSSLTLHSEITPISYSLSDCYPNPFNPETNIEFTIADNADVKLIVFNTIGEEVATILNKNLNKGKHVVKFNASYLSSGVYYYRLISGGFIKTKKMILLK